MSVLYIVLPLALIIAVVAVAAFVWSVRSGQFEDTETPALRMLHDDDELDRKARERARSAAQEPSGQDEVAQEGGHDEDRG